LVFRSKAGSLSSVESCSRMERYREAAFCTYLAQTFLSFFALPS